MPTVVSYGFARAEKTTQDTSEQLSKKYAYSTLRSGPRLRRTFS